MQFLKRFFHKIKPGFARMMPSTPIAILIGSLIIGVCIILNAYIIKSSFKYSNTGSAPIAEETVFAGKEIDSLDYVEGDKKSDVVVIEYSDTECPYCVSLHPTLKQIRNEYSGKIAFVYRHFPLIEIHPSAFDEAKAISCAGIVGGNAKFYEYVDSLFGYKSDRQSTDFPTTGKEDTAKGIGLNIDSFNRCMADTKVSDDIYASITDGVQAGVQGTPATYILRRDGDKYNVIAMISGAQSYTYFKTAIDEALSK